MSSPFIEASAPGVARALFDTSWQAAALVLVVLLVQRLFKRQLSARWSYGLWLVVVLRLALLPIAPLEVARQANPLLWRPPVQAPAQMPSPSAASSLASSAPSSALRAPKKAALSRPARDAAGYLFEPPTPVAGTPWKLWLLGLWILGAAVSILRLVFLELRFRRRWSRLPTLHSPRLEAALERARTLTGLAKTPRLVQADFLGGPAVAGLRHPALLVPPGFADELDDRALGLVLLHELFHLRRRDVHANVLFALVRSVFWFHPLAHLALTRLFAERESLRDWEALAASRSTEPRIFAETLLGLVEASANKPTPLTSPLFLPSFRRNPDLEKRLVMITRFTPRTHRSWALGSVLCLSLGWLGFTGPLSAAPVPTQAGPTTPGLGGSPATPGSPSANGQAYTPIQVQHATIEADWHRTLREKLGERLTGKVNGQTGAEAIQNFAAQLDANLVCIADPETIPDLPISIEYGATTSAVLDGLLHRIDSDLTWGLGSSSILVGYPGELPADLEVCLYNIDPLLRLGFDVDDIITFTLEQSSSGGLAWEQMGASIDAIEGQMIARVDYRTQANIESLLNRLLNYSEEREAQATHGMFLEASQSMLDVKFEDAALDGVLAELARRTGFSIGCDAESIDSDQRINIEVEGTSLFDILSLIALQCGTQLHELTGSVWIGDDRIGDAVTRIYKIDDITATFDDTDYALDMLSELIRNSIGSDYWDSNPEAVIFQLGPFLIIGATPSMHTEIEFLIDAVRASRN